ncbi:nitrilase-related carbon-nitrogen hydrolase [Paenibacillus beijingensis]|uniref:CN hydrolase domain-containing protein n=1 Tax=Paenibacillus beijingensis TaxID=1126833 RepID=A0A0D5NK22_9BACL|nr:nitrilase-related carbon-nitrogen hydrolase [Paenibacillus beijingensis]AJY75689.1 hypothetical protein VN24_15430 [Paenibacillus beijingensis]
MKVATSQYRVKMLKSFSEFEDHIRGHVESAVAQGAKLLLLPEFFTMELMTLEAYRGDTDAEVKKAFEHFAKTYTSPVKEVCSKLAKEYGIMLAAGSHFAYDDSEDRYYNTAFVFLPDGHVHVQNKIHPSYELVYNKEMTTPGSRLSVFEADGVKFGVSVCYDSSFPEVARILSKLGADVILAPTACLDEWGRSRNILFSQARASENQVFVVNSHLIGAVPFPPHLPYAFTFTGQSGIYAPIQPMIGTANGIIKQGEPNDESVIVGDLNLDYLKYIRDNGHNRNRKDMRPEFYRQFEEQFA